MAHRIGRYTVALDSRPIIVSSAAAVGTKEGDGPMAQYFDYISDDDLMESKTWEQAESLFQKTAVQLALKKARLSACEIDGIYAGDLLNQCIGSTFGLRDFEIPLTGLFGACSTMALSLITAATAVDGGSMRRAVAVTSSHFCSAERQFRFPLDYGGVRPPTSQWTVTGSGAAIISANGSGPHIDAYTIGRAVDYNISDANNMGAAMAPDDVKIRPYPTNEGMVFFYTQIQYLRGFRALFKGFLMRKTVEKSVNEIYAQSRNYYKKEEEF